SSQKNIYPMENQYLKISTSTVWVLLILQGLFVFVGALSKLQHLQFGLVALAICAFLSLSASLILINDIALSKIRDKIIWIMCMILFPSITPFVYLLKRKALMLKAEGIR